MSKRSWYQYQRLAAPYAFVAPFVFTFLIFGLYPLIKSMVLSLYITNGPKSRVFVGLGNFEFLLSDADFQKAVWNTAVFAFWSVCLQIPISLGLAILLNQKFVKGRDFFRFSFFSPHLFGQVFVAILFAIIFIPQFGLLNQALHFFFGVDKDVKWLGNPNLVMPALVLTSLWMGIGFNMIYFLAALQSIDKTLYEAAEVDGANPMQKFWNVTFPGIKPVLVFVLVIVTIGSFQLYELPYIMLNQTAGPENAGLTVVMFLYQQGFEAGDLGYASAVGWTLALIVMCVAIVQVYLSGAARSEQS